MKTERKPFDLETAIAHPEWVRDGEGTKFHSVEACDDRVYSVKAYIGPQSEYFFSYTPEGQFFYHQKTEGRDLHLEVPRVQPQERPPLEVGKTYVDARGRKVRIICVDREHPSYPCVGLVMTQAGTEDPENYTLYGAAEFHVMGTTYEPRDILREYDERDQLTPGDLVWVRDQITATAAWSIYIYVRPSEDGGIEVSRRSDLSTPVSLPTWKAYVAGEKP